MWRLVLLLFLAGAFGRTAFGLDEKWEAPSLGLSLLPLEDEPPQIEGLRPLKWPTRKALQVVAVAGPAYEAGLRVYRFRGADYGDLVYQIGDTQIDSLASLQESTAKLELGKEVVVRYYSPNDVRDKQNKVLRINWQRKTASIAPATLFQVLDSRITKTFDDVTGSTVYRVEGASLENATNEVHCWLLKTKSGDLRPQLGIRYAAPDWLFVRGYIFSIDNKRIVIDPGFDEMKRDNGSRLCWEWCNLTANPEKKGDPAWEALEAIKDAERTVKVTYIGDTYRKDRDIPLSEIFRIRAMLDYYSVLSEK